MAKPCKTPSPDAPRPSKAGASPRPTSKPGFWTVTGSDFGRSITWSKKQPNAVSQQIKTAISSSSPKTK